jgi:hypothetical protein
MKQFKRLMTVIMLTLVFSVTSTLSFAQPATAFAATTMKINKTNLTMMPGKTYTLKVTGTNNKVSWKSSKKEVASVSSNGKVKAVKNGITYITASVGGKSYKCMVSVLPTFKVDENSIVSELTGRDLTWYGQTFTVEKKDISDVTIVDVNTSDDKLTKTLTATLSLDRTVIKFDTTVVITYTANTSKWSVSNIHVSSTINELNISGSYIGNGQLNIDLHNTSTISRYMELRIDNMKSDGIFTGTFTTSANADSPTADTNVYSIKGGVNASTGVITIAIESHISGSESWGTMYDGNIDDGFFVDVAHKGISGSGAYWVNDKFAYYLVLTKNNPNTITIK